MITQSSVLFTWNWCVADFNKSILDFQESSNFDVTSNATFFAYWSCSWLRRYLAPSESEKLIWMKRFEKKEYAFPSEKNQKFFIIISSWIIAKLFKTLQKNMFLSGFILIYILSHNQTITNFGTNMKYSDTSNRFITQHTFILQRKIIFNEAYSQQRELIEIPNKNRNKKITSDSTNKLLFS
jgi:hypothetical protein